LQAACASLAAILVFWFLVIPYPWSLEIRNPSTTMLQEQRIREARRSGDTLAIRRQWVPLDQVAAAMVRAVTVAEDYRFREHDGIDWVSLAEEVHWTGDEEFNWASPQDLRALVNAATYVRANLGEIRGRSTITQQLAKNLYFGTDRTLLRKALEFVVARRLERRLDKDRILELYLNVVEFGPGIFGVEAAAQAYFRRSASALTLDQAAALAATLPHPLTSNPASSPGRMLWRKNLLLGRLGAPPEIPPEPMPLPDVELALPPPDTVASADPQAPPPGPGR
jgi:monofunctional biosynthetic peptidoglycan transglycosylase